MEVELFHEDGQTDMRLTVAFRNFSDASKNYSYSVACTRVESEV
jgi:hypothetical protein